MIRQLAKHTAIYALGDLLSKSIAFLLIPLYTHYLLPSEYGILELLELTSYILGFFLAMGVSQALMRYYHECKSTEEKCTLASSAFWLILAASGISYPALWLFSPQLSQLVFETPDYQNLFRILFAALAVQLISEVPNSLLRIEERSWVFVLISLLRVAVSLTLNIYFVTVAKLGVSGILWSGLLAASTSTTALILANRRHLRLRFSREYARQLAHFGLPLVISWAGMFILNFSDRFFLQRLSTLDEVGVYALAYKFGMIPNMLFVAPFMLYWGAKRFELSLETNAPHIFSQVFTYLIGISVFLSTGVAILAPEIFSLMADSDYHRGQNYISLILIAYVFYAAYVFEQFAIMFQKRTKLLGGIALAAAFANIGLNLLLIPTFQAFGAALATSISFAFLFGLTRYFGHTFYPVRYEYYRLGKIIGSALILFAAAQYFSFVSLWWTLGFKFILGLSFPLLLAMLGFFHQHEKSFLTGLLRRTV